MGEEHDEDLPIFHEQLPKEYQGHEYLKDYEDLGAWAKGHIELKDQVKSMVRVPDDKSTDEERAAFHKRLGKPDNADGYDLKYEYPEGMNEDQEFVKGFRGKCHELNVSTDQAKGIFSWYNDIMKGVHGLRAKQDRDLDDKLHEKYGDNYDAEIKIMRRAAKEFGGDDFLTMLDNTMIGDIPLGSNPVMIEVFNAIGHKMIDHNILPGHARDLTGDAKTKFLNDVYPNTPDD